MVTFHITEKESQKGLEELCNHEKNSFNLTNAESFKVTIEC